MKSSKLAISRFLHRWNKNRQLALPAEVRHLKHAALLKIWMAEQPYFEPNKSGNANFNSLRVERVQTHFNGDRLYQRYFKNERR
jgi:hypothetical protein